jgi:CRISPR type III-A-associated protein Csm2
MKISEVKAQLKEISVMTDLKLEDFAEEGKLADSIADHFGEKLKATQLRKVFHKIKLIEREVKKAHKQDEEFKRSSLLELMPILAYSTGRGLIPKEFYEILKECFSSERLKTNADFLRVAQFMEAIMAYHKYRSEEEKGR